MIELRPIGEFVDSLQVDREQPASVVRCCVKVIEIHGLLTVVCANPYKVTLLSYHVNQLELLEEGGDGIKALTHLGARLDRDAQRWCVVEDEAQEGVPDQP